jgi:hypothetical protein
MVAHDDRCAACGGPLELWPEAQWKSAGEGRLATDRPGVPRRRTNPRTAGD